MDINSKLTWCNSRVDCVLDAFTKYHCMTCRHTQSTWPSQFVSLQLTPAYRVALKFLLQCSTTSPPLQTGRQEVDFAVWAKTYWRMFIPSGTLLQNSMKIRNFTQKAVHHNSTRLDVCKDPAWQCQSKCFSLIRRKWRQTAKSGVWATHSLSALNQRISSARSVNRKFAVVSTSFL